MGAHHQAGARRSGLRWLAGAAGAVVGTAALFAGASANAAGSDTVQATFTATGVTSSNCPVVDTGGSDVYIKPGAELDAKANFVGINVVGASVPVGSFNGKLTIDPKSANPRTADLTQSYTKITGLQAGDHKYNYDVTAVGNLPTGPVSLGVVLHYQGTIHVTTAAADCGVAVQVPGPSVSVSVTNLPPIKVSLPPVDVKVPVDPGKVLPGGPKLPIPLPGSGSGQGSSGYHYTPPPPTIPEEVVPKANGGGYTGPGGYFGGSLPNPTAPSTAAGAQAPAASGATQAGGAATAAAPATVDPKLAKQAKNPSLAASQEPSAQLPVILAILAVIALALVTATYARMYLLKKQ